MTIVHALGDLIYLLASITALIAAHHSRRK
jgi:hypothetical protein